MPNDGTRPTYDEARANVDAWRFAATSWDPSISMAEKLEATKAIGRVNALWEVFKATEEYARRPGMDANTMYRAELAAYMKNRRISPALKDLGDPRLLNENGRLKVLDGWPDLRMNPRRAAVATRHHYFSEAQQARPEQISVAAPPAEAARRSIVPSAFPPNVSDYRERSMVQSSAYVQQVKAAKGPSQSR
jgi:hypothetical protein